MAEFSHSPAKELVASVGLPEVFLGNLLLESDWSFVIKLHALFEAVLTSLIVKKLAAPAVEDVISNLDFNNTKTGKVAFARALKIIDAKDVEFLRGLSELRNTLVHDVLKVEFELRTYVSSMDKNQRNNFRNRFGKALLEMPDGEESYNSLFLSKPLHIIYLAAHNCLLTCGFNVSDMRRNKLIEALRGSRVD